MVEFEEEERKRFCIVVDLFEEEEERECGK
jgi:predicted transcriptional regulator